MDTQSDCVGQLKPSKQSNGEINERIHIESLKWAAMLIALGAFLCAKAPVAAAGVGGDCLGYALGFSLLSFANDGDIDVGVGNAARVTSPLCFINGEVGAGHDIVFGNNGLYSGDAISFGAITLNNYAKVQGQCVTSGGAVTLKIGASCGGGVDTSDTNGLLDVLDFAQFYGGIFACDVAFGFVGAGNQYCGRKAIHRYRHRDRRSELY